MSIEDKQTMYSRVNVRIKELERFLKALEDVEDLFIDEDEEALNQLKMTTTRKLESLLIEKWELE